MEKQWLNKVKSPAVNTLAEKVQNNQQYIFYEVN